MIKDPDLPKVMTLYYDPFNADEEDDFLESEQLRGSLEIESFVTRMAENDETLMIQCFDFAMSKEQLRTILQALEKRTGNHSLKRLEFSHWGLLPNDHDGLEKLLVTVLLQLSSRIEHLALTSCGISGSNLQIIWELLTVNNTLKSLNLSRNNLGGFLHQHNLNFAFQSYSQKFTHLRELNLSAAGLTTESVQSLLNGLSSNSILHTLDISNNFDSLETLLECLLDHLPRMKALRRLILTKGASSSTCIDSQNRKSLELLQRLAQDSIQHNTSLYSFGPLYILPIDRQASDTTQRTYNGCIEYLQNIQFYLKRNQFKPLIASFVANRSVPSVLSMALENENSDVFHYILKETAGSWSNQ